MLPAVQPVYGFFGGAEPVEFLKADGVPNLYFLQDRELNLEEEARGDGTPALYPPPRCAHACLAHAQIRVPLPKPPTATYLTAHWLAIDGVQPAIPENPGAAEAPAQAPVVRAAAPAQGEPPATVVPVVAHIISKELQLYFDKITELVSERGYEGPKEIFDSLASDGGLQPLAPYFTQWVAETVSANLTHLARLRGCVRAASALLSNTRVSLELYLHQLMPALITCLVAKRLCSSPTEDHWALRDAAASALATVCARHGGAYPNVQPRLSRTLLNALLDANRPLATHYGALVGLAALGPRVVRLLVLPNASAYLQQLAPQLQAESQSNAAKRQEAERVRGALLRCCGGAAYAVLRPCAAPAPAAAAHARGARPRLVSLAAAAQRQPAAPAAPAAPPAAPAGKQKGGAKAKAPAKGKAKTPAKEPQPPAPQQQQPHADGEDEQPAGKACRVAVTALDRAQGCALEEAWREDAQAGPALAQLYELFGDAMVPFVPADSLGLTV